MVERAQFQTEYPFQSHFFNTGSYHMHYVDEGKGPTLLLIHGNPTWSFYYRNLIKHFSKNYRVIAPDHIGCGLSDKPQDYPYTLQIHIENLKELITHLNLKDVTLVVHDWGGPIGLGAFLDEPHLLKSLIIFNTGAFVGKDLTMPLRIKLVRIPFIGPFAVRVLNAFAYGALLMACKRGLSKEIRAGYLAPYKSVHNRVGILRFVQDIPWNKTKYSYHLIEKIEKHLFQFSKIPTLILWGKKDFCFTEKFLNYWRKYLPKAHVQVFNEAGHYVLEDAHEKIIPVIENFLKRLPLDVRTSASP